MRKFRFLPLLVAGAFVVGACSDDNGTGTTAGDTPTAAEQDALLEVLALVGALPGVGSFDSPAAAGPQAAPQVDIDYNYSDSCPEGGSVNVTGKYSSDIDPNNPTAGGTYSFDITQDFNGCKSADTDNTVIVTVDGDPNVKISGDITIGSSQLDFSGSLSWKGGIKWSSDAGSSGTCAIDVTYNFGTFTGSGSVCGESITLD
jgi:hypothetical protein